MTHPLRALSVLVFAAALLALAVGLSCKTFDTPNETCSPSAQLQTTVAGHQDGTCTRCLEDNCCDKVGVCERKGGCNAAVSKTYDCVLEAGVRAASKERDCVDGGVAAISEADNAYRCMRDRCGAECGLPVCQPDPAVVLISNPDCDSCFASSCCTELNKCYGSRACKLSVECIVRDCGPLLGRALIEDRLKAMTGMGTMGPPPGAGPSADLCGTTPPRDFSAPECARACLCKFRVDDQGLEPLDPSLTPFRLALAVYTCAAKANCGPPCSADAGAD